MSATTNPTRREFLAASALGVLGMTSLARHSTPESELLFVGSYTDSRGPEGIYLVRMDSRSGELRAVAAFDAGPNPSFLAMHPKRNVLYAVNEVSERNGEPAGGVAAFEIAHDGTLTKLSTQPSGGRGPCYVSVDGEGRAALVANYDDGCVALLPIEGRAALAPPASIARHTGHGPNAERQQAPHAHCIVAHRDGRFALAADLGTDRVLVYELGPRALRHHEPGDAIMRPGAGPRHIAFHPSLMFLFVTNELDSTVATLHFDAIQGLVSPVSVTSTLPNGWSGANFPADVHVAPAGDVLYVSNRGHDSIAVFAIDKSTGALTLGQTLSTEGHWPRNFSLDPSGRWLVVANQNSGSLVVFARETMTGRLTPTGHRLAIPNPACVRFRAATI